MKVHNFGTDALPQTYLDFIRDTLSKDDGDLMIMWAFSQNVPLDRILTWPGAVTVTELTTDELIDICYTLDSFGAEYLPHRELNIITFDAEYVWIVE